MPDDFFFVSRYRIGILLLFGSSVYTILMEESKYVCSLSTLALEMTAYYSGDPKRIQHFLKVHGFARLIGEVENLDSHMLFILETAALVHDIGIKYCEATYGACGGKLQEKEGPAIARTLLEKLGYDSPDIERVCYLVGHHHTYSAIDGIDYQILVEADFLVNLYEDDIPQSGIRHAVETIFKTDTGLRLCRSMFPIQ